MEHTDNAAATYSGSRPIRKPATAAATSSYNSVSFSPSSSGANSSPSGGGSGGGTCAAATPPPPTVVLSPCAACKILRRRCVEKCVLAPYFPPNDPIKFTVAHKVFGASNIIKMLQEIPDHKRADAIESMVYEANTRIRDPVYGCAGAILQLQNQICDLQSQLAKANAEILNMRCKNEYLVSMIYMDSISQNQEIINSPNYPCDDDNNNINILLDDGNLYDAWEPLWA